MTETIAHPVIDDVDTPGPFGSMGRAASGYKVEVRRDDGALTEPEEQGNLFIQGEPGLSLFAEYLHDHAATRDAVDPNGWLNTGDRATWRPDGYLVFGDRSKDMLKVGGENVAASEVERVVMEVEGVSEVAVVSAPDKFLGEVPVAFVIPTQGADDLEMRVLSACKERLASFKAPREVRIVDSLPRSTLNKIAKAELRASLRDATEPAERI
jgi:crotonobetaine/carnitine-CoA ligase